MTDQEAEIKRVISYIRSCREAGIDTTITIDKNRSHFILNALEEIQQYRATGLTPRMVEKLKDNDKRSHKLAVQRATELDEYRALGTVEELREAMEKQRKNKMKNRCPDCGTPIKRCYFYCPGCGQAIDYSEEEN